MSETCNNKLFQAGKGYPRTCRECGLGPCKHGVAVRTPSDVANDKHMETARFIADDIPSRVMDVNRKFASIVIARALANAERDGMRRAVEIIRTGVDRPVSVSHRMDGKPSKNDKCPHDFYMYEDCEECCLAAILSEAGEVA